MVFVEDVAMANHKLLPVYETPTKMKVLVACEFSGRVREAFHKKGHDTWSCDLLPSEIPGKHIQGDVLEILDDKWDLMIAHPPCTRLCNSGVCWLQKRNLWKEMRKACKFFRILMESSIPRICVENPVPHKYAIHEIGKKYTQIIQPWQFGHEESKATCLWLKNLPLLIPTKIMNKREQRLHHLPPSIDRWKLRSITFQGIANAMAEQWG
jgi:hypothetical protein